MGEDSRLGNWKYRRAAAKVSPMTTGRTHEMQQQRFELKYRIDEMKARQVREFVAGYMELDEYGVGKPDYAYPVHSLYLDSEDLKTYWMTINGDKNRYKLRLRFYNDKIDSPVFFEVKRRMNNIIMKQRGGVRKEAVHWLLQGHLPDPDHMISQEAKHVIALQRFSQLMQELKATPKVHVAYLREAWVNPTDNAARVTFDRRVCAEPRFEPSFSTDLLNPAMPFGEEVILELKFTNRFPKWFKLMVEHFDLFQMGAAKYCDGIDGIGVERLRKLAAIPKVPSEHSSNVVSLES